MTLKDLLVFVTGFCVGLVVAIAISTNWHISLSFGHAHDNVVINGVEHPELNQFMTYYVQATDSNGERWLASDDNALEWIAREQ